MRTTANCLIRMVLRLPYKQGYQARRDDCYHTYWTYIVLRTYIYILCTTMYRYRYNDDCYVYVSCIPTQSPITPLTPSFWTSRVFAPTRSCLVTGAGVASLGVTSDPDHFLYSPIIFFYSLHFFFFFFLFLSGIVFFFLVRRFRNENRLSEY